ncbi:hypothetical protein F4781DRAFT_332539 [Annulohypoxylon bovei var. microspora]|nr:hypothetical protein F4781DRAFT_332539 [Annulohypoxylon bovei var. microspora]
MMYSILLVGAGLAAQASAACTREQLVAATDAYIQAVAAGDPALPGLADNMTYLENDAPMDIATGVLSQAITIDFNRSLHDSVACATFTEISAATNEAPYVIATRMLLADGKVTAIQSVVANDGDWAFNATGQLYWTKQETWDAIPEGQRDARDVIKAAGDAYLDSWGDGTVAVPYGTPCARLEGGSYTGSGQPTANTCTMPQFPSAFKISNRRYVIDEEVGGLDIFNDFPFIDAAKPDGTASTNFFRVEGGKIRYIHETTICTNRNCGR